MSPLLSEIFKAVFIVAIFACVCGVARGLTIRHLTPRLKAALSGFLLLLLLPTSYLYLRLAFPAAAAILLPLQSFAIWLYGPVLLWILHTVTHQRVRAWQGCLYGASLLVGTTFLAATYAGRSAWGPWWQLLSLAQAVLFAVAALVWTVRRRAQLRILVTAFSNSSFGPLLYLSFGILALLSFDFVVHTRIYLGTPLPPAQFYSWVAPCALYTLGISLWIIWQPRADADLPLSTLKEPAAPESAPTPNTRKLELSPTAAQELARLLDAQMREKRLHTRNDLSLSALARSLHVSTHLTSELLNAHLRTTFYDYVNAYRTAEAAELLRSQHCHLSIADVAYEAGFNNANTFYREFKRAYGMTPAQFRRRAIVPQAKQAKDSVGAVSS